MNLAMYRVSGSCISGLRRLLRMNLRVTGADRLSDSPTLFAVNHFTRFETVLVPYLVYRYAGRTVHSLATHTLFKGLLASFLRGCGVMSIRNPRRNRTIISELMTNTSDWVIYPEGGLIKNKKTMRNGRLFLSHPRRSGPPHTGAAMLALKSEIAKRRYLSACASGDERRRAWYEESFDLDGPQSVSAEGTVVVPVSITYHPMRSGRNLVSWLIRLAKREIDPRVAEEMAVEGKILFSRPDVSVHFGEPIPVAEYLDRTTELARRVFGMFSEDRQTELFLRRQARRLTAASMRSVYRSTEINLDHLFCFGLRAFREGRVSRESFHRALYLAALQLRARDDVRVHPVLANGVSSLISRYPFAPLESVLELAAREGVVRVDGDDYVIDRTALNEEHGFHDIRVQKMVQVIANELEPVDPAVAAVERAVNMTEPDLTGAIAQASQISDQVLFRREYEQWSDEKSKPAELGEPFLLESRRPRTGVILAHGYLACPEQMRPLAEHLHAEGHSVYVTRLAGHGTSPRQLTTVDSHEWVDSLIQGYAALRHSCDRIVAGGFSLGGTLALLLAARRGDIDGVFCINAPMRVRDRRAPLVGPVVAGHRLFRRIGLLRELVRCNAASECPDVAYLTDFLHGVRELRRTVRRCRKQLSQVEAATLVIQAADDPVVAAVSATLLEKGLVSSDVKVVHLPLDRHVIVRGEGSEAVYDQITGFLDDIVGDRVDGPG